MFTSAVQRIVWKEFRAQRTIWFGIAFELVILQLFKAFAPDKFPVSLMSLACVLTGIFAMTSSALLFAGESEAQTEGFLRQLPFRSRELILGKLGFSIAAVASFLGVSLLTSKLVGDIGGTGRPLIGDFEDTVAFAHSILGLWAWGIFYSLLTRKVMWTLLGAALTEILVNAALHGVLKGHRYDGSSVYAVYRSIVLVVLLVDVWLLSRWYTGSWLPRDVSHSLAASAAGESSLTVSAPHLPWAKSWKMAGVAGVAMGVLWQIVASASATRSIWINGRDAQYLPTILLSGAIGVGIGAIVVTGMRAFRSSGSLRFSGALKLVCRLLALFTVCVLAFALGIAVGFSGIFLLIVAFVDWHLMPELRFISGISATICAGGGFTLWGVGKLLDGSEKSRTSRFAIRTLQFAQSTFRSIDRSWGSLLWIETRRALPFLIGGVLALGTMALLLSLSTGETRWTSGLIGLLIVSYTCGLMTILPDRSQGTLSFLIERGVPASRVLTAKLVVWGVTLGLLAIIPLIVSFPIWGQMNREQGLLQLGTVGVSPVSWISNPATLFFGGLIVGLFAIGAVSATWIRRPILAVIGGLVGYILWVAWCVVLLGNQSLFGMAIFWPIVLLLIGYFASGTTTLLEQANWKSKVRRVAWVLLTVVGSFYWLRDFRTHEIPVSEAFQSLQNRYAARGVQLDIPEPMLPAARQSLLNRYAENMRLNASRTPAELNLSGWETVSNAESTVYRLNLHLPSCDLAASLKSLATGLEASYEMARNAPNEGVLVEATRMRRLVLSAIRKWANHPAQTAALLEEAALRFESLARGDRFGATDLLAIQYHDAIQAIESGVMPSRSIAGQPPHEDNPLVRLILKLSGEQERVRQLVDLQFSLLPSYISLDPSLNISGVKLLETACVNWTKNTSLSLSALGVTLPSMNYAQALRGEMWQLRVSSQATVLVLELQLYRVKNGQFPATLIEVMQPGQMDASSFGYEPHGFARNLRISPLKALPAHQPVIYSQGGSLGALPRGVELVDPGVDGRAFYRARGWSNGLSHMPQKSMFENASPLQLSLQTEFIAKTEYTVQPNEIRFISTDSERDEDRLYLPPDQRVEVDVNAVLSQNPVETQPEASSQPEVPPGGSIHTLSPSAVPDDDPAAQPSQIPPIPPESQSTDEESE